ncbi:hypothetical protein V8F20_003351 [Naviculisporaceae sp. PSN 640]
MTDPAKARSLYRSLLRELPPRPILVKPRQPIHSQLRKHFIYQPQKWTGPERAVGLAVAEQYKAYFQAQRHYVSLIEQYNPGMGMSTEERVRLSARRVGMDLPKDYNNTTEGGNGGNGKEQICKQVPLSISVPVPVPEIQTQIQIPEKYDPLEHWTDRIQRLRTIDVRRLEKAAKKEIEHRRRIRENGGWVLKGTGWRRPTGWKTVWRTLEGWNRGEREN